MAKISDLAGMKLDKWGVVLPVISWIKTCRPVHFEGGLWSTKCLLAIVTRMHKQRLLSLPSMQIGLQLHYVTCSTRVTRKCHSVFKLHYLWTCWCFNRLLFLFMFTFPSCWNSSAECLFCALWWFGCYPPWPHKKITQTGLSQLEVEWSFVCTA